MFYQSFSKNMGDPYYEPTIVVHDKELSTTAIRTTRFFCPYQPSQDNSPSAENTFQME